MTSLEAHLLPSLTMLRAEGPLPLSDPKQLIIRVSLSFISQARARLRGKVGVTNNDCLHLCVNWDCSVQNGSYVSKLSARDNAVNICLSNFHGSDDVLILVRLDPGCRLAGLPRLSPAFRLCACSIIWNM